MSIEMYKRREKELEGLHPDDRPDYAYKHLPNPLTWLSLSETGHQQLHRLDARSHYAMMRIYFMVREQRERKTGKWLHPWPWMDYREDPFLTKDSPYAQVWIERGERLKRAEEVGQNWLEDVESTMEEGWKAGSQGKYSNVPDGVSLEDAVWTELEEARSNSPPPPPPADAIGIMKEPYRERIYRASGAQISLRKNVHALCPLLGAISNVAPQFCHADDMLARAADLLTLANELEALGQLMKKEDKRDQSRRRWLKRKREEEGVEEANKRTRL
ncbi:hypothetical protein FISHEDRAFT_58567 [Fistulina hepatica ATCC 64428]|uniref:Uncharacterized protein n=1 Tax=Fistulina hepatica ATCC 64428 TaxID=1128425 RepID=A0A0D7AF16_9AGAR|nr:hypothetical protein FISHEDRAFT_58567 [Fistulina hepatica ATCC 64428]